MLSRTVQIEITSRFSQIISIFYNYLPPLLYAFWLCGGGQREGVIPGSDQGLLLELCIVASSDGAGGTT